MATFKYEGISTDGSTVTGVVNAISQFEALEKARESCRIVKSVKQVHEKPSIFARELGSPLIDANVISIMCQQFATVIDSGMGMARCVSLVADQTSDKKLKAILEEVATQVASGHSLATSFETEGANRLPSIFYETIRAGEQAGTLDQSFLTLSAYFDKRSRTRAKLVQSLTYPAFVVVLAIVVVAVMMIFVVPSFKGILASYGSQMPAMTASLIAISEFFSNYIIWIVLVIVVAIIAFNFWKRSEKGREQWARAKLSMPVIGKISQFSNAAQFANTLALLLQSGLGMTKAITVTSKVIDNYLLSKNIEKATTGLEEGKSLGACLAAIPFMPRALVEMAAVGEETGSLEETLSTMGAFYDEETQRATNKAISRLEPAILIFIALFAGYIVIALYLAMFSIYGNM